MRLNVSLRRYADATDYWRVHEFLRAVYLLNQRRERAWSVLRWDYWRWHIHENIFRFNLPEVVWLWEHDSQIVAVLNPDGPGEAFLQMHPAFRTVALLEAMLAKAEGRLAEVAEDGRRTLRIWVAADAREQQQLLAMHGYQKNAGPEYQRRRLLSQPIAATPLPDGYTIRAVGEDDDLPARSWVSWEAFHPDEPDERYQGWAWYRNVQRIPLYRRDLDLVAVAPSGEHAAFSTAWFDDVTRSVVFEPVGTHPNHRQRGLGKAVMAEGLRRAHALYVSLGFIGYDLSEPWDKTW